MERAGLCAFARPAWQPSSLAAELAACFARQRDVLCTALLPRAILTPCCSAWAPRASVFYRFVQRRRRLRLFRAPRPSQRSQPCFSADGSGSGRRGQVSLQGEFALRHRGVTPLFTAQPQLDACCGCVNSGSPSARRRVRNARNSRPRVRAAAGAALRRRRRARRQRRRRAAGHSRRSTRRAAAGRRRPQCRRVRVRGEHFLTEFALDERDAGGGRAHRVRERFFGSRGRVTAASPCPPPPSRAPSARPASRCSRRTSSTSASPQASAPRPCRARLDRYARRADGARARR